MLPENHCKFLATFTQRYIVLSILITESQSLVNWVQSDLRSAEN